MNNSALKVNEKFQKDGFIDSVICFSDSLLRKNWKQMMKILDLAVPFCIGQNYSFLKSSSVKQINLQIYRELKHAKRVSIYAQRLARALSCSAIEIRDIEYCGFVHDLGKLVIDQRILYKETALSQNEWKIIRNHPRFSSELLTWSKQFSYLAPVIEQHHEWWDGNGYPKHLVGEEILQPSRILSVADAYDAMTCNRSYQHRMESSAAAEEIKRCAGTQFDPEIAFTFVEMVLKEENCSIFKNIQPLQR